MSTTKNISPAKVETYLYYEGRCEEAVEFYRRALGAEVSFMMRFKDSPVPHQPGMCPSGSDEKIMHASLQIGDTRLMVSDGRCTGKPNFQGMALTIAVPNEAEVERIFTALAAGGNIQMPLAKTFFSALFGMVADRFGVTWIVMVSQ